MFNRKPARMLNNDGVTPKHVVTSDRNSTMELIGYQHDLGLLGQPITFYVGICFGLVFQAALVTIAFSLA